MRERFTPENLHYAIIENGRHDIDACERYLYYGLQDFFGQTETSAENAEEEVLGESDGEEEADDGFDPANRDTKVLDVIHSPVFEGYGRLLFPTDRTISDDLTLENVESILTWYNDVNPDKTVEIVNYLGEQAASGNQVFFDIYTEEEKAEDPEKEDTGLFFFRGEPGGKTAICNAGGGFVYVGAMQDSFPHALELSKNGYNAFALIYRPGAQTACEDLARAIAFLHDHAEELGIDMTDYSLWGGSAGARMAAWLGSYGTESFGEKEYPRPAAVIMQYTGLSEVTGNEPPTYNCVGTSAGAEVRHGAFLRGNTIIGEGAVVGNSCELKNVVLFNGAQVPHFNYVGDSILGYKAHMGAGAVTSNVKSDKTLVKIHAADGDIETGLKKVGAFLGDGVEVGCQTVLNPGTVVGRNTNIYPLSSVRGCVAANSIYKKADEIVEKEERETEETTK